MFREEYLYPDFVPDKLLHREREIQEIIDAAGPLVHDKKPRNVFVFGKAGIGKTAVCLNIIKSFEIESLYVNCFSYRREASLFSEILRQMGIPTGVRGIPKDELVVMFLEQAKDRKLFIVLDEIDALEDRDALYSLSRASNLIALVLISNNPMAMSKLDDRIQSSLQPRALEFRPYSVEQVFDILKNRADLVFRQYDETALKIAARLTFKHGSDIRYGLRLLLEAARRGGLEVEHIREEEKQPKRKLEGDYLKLFELIKNKEQISSGELLAAYQTAGGELAERTVRKYLDQLIVWGYLKAKERSLGRGRTRIFSIKQT
ncbi:MAG: AAA family ATPase [Candidatus Altiarchaeota archaeon]|nr:AAA family ATPase [Candidatus Altiarchaeota archaeon]